MYEITYAAWYLTCVVLIVLLASKHKDTRERVGSLERQNRQLKDDLEKLAERLKKVEPRG